MAALATQSLGSGGAYTLAAAAGGGDTIEAGAVAGGWMVPMLLIANVGATPTTITVDGTAYGSFTTQLVCIVVPNGVQGSRKNITYNNVTGVTVGAVSLGTRGHTVFGT